MKKTKFHQTPSEAKIVNLISKQDCTEAFLHEILVIQKQSMHKATFPKLLRVLLNDKKIIVREKKRSTMTRTSYYYSLSPAYLRHLAPALYHLN